MSLKQRLLLWALSTVALVWTGAAAFTYYDARHELNQVLDAHLAQASTLLVAQFTEELDDIDTEHTPQLHPYSRRVAFQVWEDGRKLRLHSLNAPSTPLANQQEGFSNTLIDGERWRVFTTRTRHDDDDDHKRDKHEDDDDDMLIHVAERADVREQLADSIVTNLLRPLWVALPLLGVLLWLAVSASLRPLVELTRAVAQRKPDNLAPLSMEAPGEVLPLIERLNHLFARTGSLIENERRFTADAAHELRTPIAGIKAQVQVAQGAMDKGERTHALDQALQGCNRATHLIGQLLTLARLETADVADLQSCSLRQLATEVITDMAAPALEQGVHLGLADGKDVQVEALPTLLGILLRNLLDNAIRHTGSGTQVNVAVEMQGPHPCLSVCDDGPGLPAEELEKIAQRFYRPLGTEASGSGLGLSIVQRIAATHRAELRIAGGENGRGLCVRMVFLPH